MSCAMRDGTRARIFYFSLANQQPEHFLPTREDLPGDEFTGRLPSIEN